MGGAAVTPLSEIRAMLWRIGRLMRQPKKKTGRRANYAIGKRKHGIIVTPALISCLMIHDRPIASFDRVLPGGESVADLIPDRRELGREREEDAAEAVARVAAILRGLPKRDREILERRFGIGGRREETLDEIGARRGLSRERIRQIQNKALERCRRIARLNSYAPAS